MKRCIYLVVFIALSCSPFRKVQNSAATHNSKEDFHIYLLLGQSNMAGRGPIEAIDTVVHPCIFMFNKNDTWVPAKNPIHFDIPKLTGTGLGFSFAHTLAAQDSTINIGLIPCAIGGSSINQWKKRSFHTITQNYPYDEALVRINKGRTKGVIKGVLWHQGEADSKTTEDITVYKEKFLAFKDSLEKDLGLKDIPFVLGEIGHFVYEKRPLAKDLNAILKEISNEHRTIQLISSDSLNHKGDKLHFDTPSYRKLGVRYAEGMLHLQNQLQSISGKSPKKRRFKLKLNKKSIL